jgi:CheY-like chemotaxis protein
MKKKILVVEDNNDSRAILVLMLRNMGYQAIEARNSKEAIANAEAEQPTSFLRIWDYRIVTESTRAQF